MLELHLWRILSYIFILSLPLVLCETANTGLTPNDPRQSASPDSAAAASKQGDSNNLLDSVFAHGPALETAHNYTRECLANFTLIEDNSVCYGDDEWPWDPIAIICVSGTMYWLVVFGWLLVLWLQRGALWLLEDPDVTDVAAGVAIRPQEGGGTPSPDGGAHENGEAHHGEKARPEAENSQSIDAERLDLRGKSSCLKNAFTHLPELPVFRLNGQDPTSIPCQRCCARILRSQSF